MDTSWLEYGLTKIRPLAGLALDVLSPWGAGAKDPYTGRAFESTGLYPRREAAMPNGLFKLAGGAVRRLAARYGEQKLLPAATSTAITLAKRSGGLRGLAKYGVGAAGLGAAAYGGYEALAGGAPMRRRRMNPLNGRAAARAIRRIKAARHMLQKIERQMPKRKCSCSARSTFPRRRRRTC